MLNCRPVANQTERATSITQPRAFPRCRIATTATPSRTMGARPTESTDSQ